MHLSNFLFVFFCFVYFNSFSQKNTHIDQHKQEQTHTLNHDKIFLENKGQWPEGVLFNTKMEGGKVWFQQHKMIYHLQDYSAMHELHAMKNPSFQGGEAQQTVIHANFIGSNAVSIIEKSGKSKTYFNFFKGNDKTKWTSDVHGYESFVLKEFYKGID